MVLRLLVRLALLAHPAEMRRRYGAEMARLLEEDPAVSRESGTLVRLTSQMAALWDIMRTGLQERIADAAAPPRVSHPGSRPRLMDQLRGDLRFAVRSLLRRPAFAAVAVFTLALGIGSTTAIFSVVNGVLLRSLPFADPDRLVRIWSTDRLEPAGPTDGSVSPVTFEEWRTQATTFESMALYSATRPTLTGMGEPEVIRAGRVSPDFFDVMGAPPMIGRAFTADEDRPEGPLAVVVSHGFWQERLGARADAVGGVLELNGRSHTVIGVAPAGLDFPNGARLWIPVRNNAENCGHGCIYMNAVGRLRPEVTVEQAEADLLAVSDRLSETFPGALLNSRGALATLHDTTVGNVRTALLLLLGAVGMVLLIACANVANLLIARGATRADEMAVRAALGAGRRRMVSQLMTESLVLGTTSGVVGVMLALGMVRALRALAPAGIPRIDEIGVDATALAFAAVLAVLTTVLFGLAPAVRLATGSVAGTLRQDGARTLGVSRGIGRSALLAAEVGLSLLLLVGAGLLLRSFASMQRLDPGFAVERISHFSVSLPGARYPDPDAVVRFADELERRLEATTGASQVTLSLGAPLGNQSVWTSFTRTDQPPPEPGEGPSAGMRMVGSDFFETMDIDILSGRAFTPADRHGAAPVVVLNETVARQFFPGEDPIGRALSLGVWMGYPEDEPRMVIGVARDVRWESLTGEPVPELFVPYAQTAPSFVTFLMRAPSEVNVLAPAREQVRALDPALPFRDPGTMRAMIDAQTASQRFYLLLLAIFAAMAVTLAAVGLYGVVAYLVAQRRREIGVRMALGARRSAVVGLVLRQGLVPAAAGAAIGLAVALAGTRLMGSLLFGITATDPLTFVGVTTVLLLVVLIACLIPAGRATRIPPASALRAER